MNHIKREILKEILKDPVAKGDLISYVSSNSNSAIIVMKDGTAYQVNSECINELEEPNNILENSHKYYAAICLSFILASVVIGKLVYHDAGEPWLILGMCTSFLITLTCHISCYLFSDAINSIIEKQ